MNDDNDKTKPTAPEFDFSAYPADSVFHDRRTGRDRRHPGPPTADSSSGKDSQRPPRPERRARKERRKRIDPTTFEKQYTEEELEFMGAMQRFKERTGKAFPTYGEVIRVAVSLGYRRLVEDPSDADLSSDSTVPLDAPLLHRPWA
jgi:hypothetical protein